MADVLTGKILQVGEDSRLGPEHSNPDVEWIPGGPWMHARNGSDQAQSSSSTPVGRVDLCKLVRIQPLGRSMDHVSNPDQGGALLGKVRTTLLLPRMTENSFCQLLLPAAHRHSQPCPTDPHSLLMCPNCGSDQDLTVC